MSKHEKKQATCWMTGTKFEVGDIVTRGGDDLQKILDTNGYDMIEVECVKEPLVYLNEDGSPQEPWCKLGDREWNLTRRYSFPGEEVMRARARSQAYASYYREAMDTLAKGVIISYGVKPPALPSSLRETLQGLSDYLQADRDAENTRNRIMLAAIDGGAV